MTRADNTHHLAIAAAARHDATTTRARQAIDTLDRAGSPITIAAVARAASVSRSWLYRQPDLRATIMRLRDLPGRARTAPLPATQHTTSESLRHRLDATRDEVTRLRADNALLRDQFARALGENRAHP